SEAASDEVAHSYVQYIESTGEQTIYTTSNGQMYPVYTVGGESGTTMYTPSSGQYYTQGNTTPVTYTQVPGGLATPGAPNTQILGNAAYLIQQGVEAEHGIITGTRASPQTVSADVAYLVPDATNGGGTNNGAGGGPVGAGTGAAAQPGTSPLDEAPNIAPATRVSPTTVQWLVENYETAEGVSLPRSTLYNHYLAIATTTSWILSTLRLSGNSSDLSFLACELEDSAPGATPNPITTGFARGGVSLQEYLGEGSGAIPEFPEVEAPPGTSLLPCAPWRTSTLSAQLSGTLETFLDAIVNLEFATIETLWREFWRTQEHSNGDECEEEKYLSKTKLFMLSKFKPIQEFVKRVDFLFYQNLVQVLIPDVLRPIPSSLTQAIRNFAKGLESWLSSAMQGCPSDMIDIKVSAVAAFAQTLRRYTSLNHLAQAARAVLQNSVQINQMLTDLNRVDFHNVQEQASWVCQCDGSLVARLEADFKATLQQQNSLEQWAAWLKAVVATVLKPYQGRPNFTTAARQLLLKWSFYSSMVIRDLTLRSAASFGSFHLIRLLYDEYMFYLIEHQVALATGETPIAVMGDVRKSEASSNEFEMTNGAPNNNNNSSNNNNNTDQLHVLQELHQRPAKGINLA
ncbi:hypothetical protein GE061_007922, partial [Apolygus lucorum]